MKKIIIVLLIIIFCGCSEKQKKKSIAKPLTIGTWNIQIFGQSKIRNKTVMKRIVEIISKYDVIAIQEERSKKSIANIFKSMLNVYCIKNKIDRNFDIVTSDREGRSLARSISKERYIIAFNTKRIKLIDKLKSRNNKFERPPFSVYLQDKKTLFDFILINFHSKPSDIKNEIPELEETIKRVMMKWKSEKDIFLVGDFNANDRFLKEYLPIKYRIMFFRSNTTSNTANTKLYDNILVFNQKTNITYKKIIKIKSKKISDHKPLLIKILE